MHNMHVFIHTLCICKHLYHTSMFIFSSNRQMGFLGNSENYFHLELTKTGGNGKSVGFDVDKILAGLPNNSYCTRKR